MLTDMTVRQTKATGKPYTIADFDGLSLFVATTGAKTWHFRYTWGGRRVRISLGCYPELSLREVRELRDEACSLVARGITPPHRAQEEAPGHQARRREYLHGGLRNVDGAPAAHPRRGTPPRGGRRLQHIPKHGGGLGGSGPQACKQCLFLRPLPRGTAFDQPTCSATLRCSIRPAKEAASTADNACPGTVTRSMPVRACAISAYCA